MMASVQECQRGRRRRLALLAILFAPTAWGQLALSVVDANGERPVIAVCDLGGVSPEEVATARFRVRNTTDAPALVSVLSVRGTGFTLAGAPAIPAAIPARESIDFRVEFAAATVATYSAEFDLNGAPVLLVASVLPQLTYPAGGIDFGTVEAGASATRGVTVRNLSGTALPPPLVAVSGEAFSLGDSGGMQFDVVFHPAGAGTWTGTLQIDDRTYRLSGTAVGIPLPKPLLQVDQGTIAVTLDAPARTAGAGVLTLDFDGPPDPAIQLGVAGRSLPFTIAPGDTRVRFGDLDAVAISTGTTAGTIGITVELGGATDRKTVTIPPAPVTILAAEASRQAGAIEVRVRGFDNTRTAGAVTYTFFDSSGAPLASMPVDDRPEFATYFAGSDAGGMFLLRSVFPVSGDASRIVEFAVQMTNSAGSATTGRVRF